MQVIATHDFADFDALAAAVAAQRLYSGAIIVIGRGVSPDVHLFLTLHRDRFPSRALSELDQDAVRTWIVVDVRRKGRLGAFARLLERIEAGDTDLRIHVWDHHPPSADDLRASELHVDDVGSATTLLVEEIRRRSLRIDAIEATLFALGIHSDTGSLRFASATARDAAALAWLMERGANTRAVDRYLDPPFSAAQREILADVLERTRVRCVSGFRIGWCAIERPERCSGLDVVTSESRALLGLSALILVHEVSGKRVDVIARSATPLIDVAELVREVGGGGHPSAASASVPGLGADEVMQRLEAELAAHPPRPRPVAELMSAPVHVVSPDMPLATLADALGAWEHTGVPVVEAGKLVGIASRRDVEKAKVRDALHLPISGFMTREVQTIAPDASLEEAMTLMQTHDIGRLPVVRGDALLGIVTRSDVLRALYEP